MVDAADAVRQIVEAIEMNKKRVLIGSDATTMWRANQIGPDLDRDLSYQGMRNLLPPKS